MNQPLSTDEEFLNFLRLITETNVIENNLLVGPNQIDPINQLVEPINQQSESNQSEPFIQLLEPVNQLPSQALWQFEQIDQLPAPSQTWYPIEELSQFMSGNLLDQTYSEQQWPFIELDMDKSSGPEINQTNQTYPMIESQTGRGLPYPLRSASKKTPQPTNNSQEKDKPKRGRGRPKGTFKKKSNQLQVEPQTSASATIVPTHVDQDNMTSPVPSPEQPTLDIEPFYRLLKQSREENKKFKIYRDTLTFEVVNKTFKNIQELDEEFVQLFQQLFENHVNPVPNDSLISIYINSQLFEAPIKTKLLSKAEITPTMLHVQLFEAVQSKKSQGKLQQFNLGKLTIGVTVAQKITGSGMIRKKRVSQELIDKFKNAKGMTRLMLTSTNYHIIERDKGDLDDNKCLIKAIVIGTYHADRVKNSSNMCRAGCKVVADRVKAIKEQLALPDSPLGLNHVKMIEEYLNAYQIVIYGSGYREDAPLYWNSNNNYNKYIYLLHQDNHYSLIRSIK